MLVVWNMTPLCTSCLQVQWAKIIDTQDFNIAKTNVAGYR